MASLAQLAVWCGYALVRDGVGLVFPNATPTTNDALAPREILHKAPIIRARIKKELNKLKS
jgi:hypothetical protein